MKTELFRKVQCSERLPDKSADYFTSKSLATFDTEDKKWTQYGFAGWETLRAVRWWLEPMEPVSMDQLNELIQPHAITLEHGEKAAQAIHDLIYGKEGGGMTFLHKHEWRYIGRHKRICLLCQIVQQKSIFGTWRTTERNPIKYHKYY